VEEASARQAVITAAQEGQQAKHSIATIAPSRW
jgi:hypothetical protein